MKDVEDEKILFKNAKPHTVRRHCKNNQVYKGYRFISLDRDQEIVEIPPTVEVDRSPTYEQVVQVDKDKTKVVCIYPNPKIAASESMKVMRPKHDYTQEDIKRLNKSITNNLAEDENTIAYGFRWYHFSDAPEELVEAYLETNDLPEVIINKGQKKIYKFDKNKTFLYDYKSTAECLRLEHITDRKLKEYITEEKLFNNECYFSYKEKMDEESDEESESEIEDENEVEEKQDDYPS